MGFKEYETQRVERLKSNLVMEEKNLEMTRCNLKEGDEVRAVALEGIRRLKNVLRRRERHMNRR